MPYLAQFLMHAPTYHGLAIWRHPENRLTRGRAAWNVVTAINHDPHANDGEAMPATDERDDRAEELIEVCQKLWRSPRWCRCCSGAVSFAARIGLDAAGALAADGRAVVAIVAMPILIHATWLAGLALRTAASRMTAVSISAAQSV